MHPVYRPTRWTIAAAELSLPVDPAPTSSRTSAGRLSASRGAPERGAAIGVALPSRRGALCSLPRHVMSTGAPAAEAVPKGIVDSAVSSVWHSILTPGATGGLMAVFFAVMLVLLGTVVFLLVVSGANMHVMIMGGLWVGLACSVLW
jgi:hypothetical protein